MADMTREKALEVLCIMECGLHSTPIEKEALRYAIAAIQLEKERELQQLWKTCPQCGLEDLAYHLNCACCGNSMKDVPAHNGRMDEEGEHAAD